MRAYLLLACVCLASASLAQVPVAPWPSSSHDSGASCAAPPGTPVPACAHLAQVTLPFSGSWNAVPAPGVYVYCDRQTVYGYDKRARHHWSFKISPLMSRSAPTRASRSIPPW